MSKTYGWLELTIKRGKTHTTPCNMYTVSCGLEMYIYGKINYLMISCIYLDWVQQDYGFNQLICLPLVVRDMKRVTSSLLVLLRVVRDSVV